LPAFAAHAKQASISAFATPSPIGIDAEHSDLRLLRREDRLVVLDPLVELQGGAPEDPAVVERGEDEGDVRAGADVRDQLEVPVPRVAVGELAIGERRHPARLLVLVGTGGTDLDRHRGSVPPSGGQ
jgi:hypothetical protein